MFQLIKVGAAGALHFQCAVMERGWNTILALQRMPLSLCRRRHRALDRDGDVDARRRAPDVAASERQPQRGETQSMLSRQRRRQQCRRLLVQICRTPRVNYWAGQRNGALYGGVRSTRRGRRAAIMMTDPSSGHWKTNVTGTITNCTRPFRNTSSNCWAGARSWPMRSRKRLGAGGGLAKMITASLLCACMIKSAKACDVRQLEFLFVGPRQASRPPRVQYRVLACNGVGR